MAATSVDLDLVSRVLKHGPPDGLDILHHVQSNDLWHTLYLATRMSPNAEQWRVVFGTSFGDRVSKTNSILQMAVASLEHNLPNSTTTEFALKLIANCCADNNDNRRVLLEVNGVGALMRLLNTSCDPNVLVPTLYNVCTDYDEPANLTMNPDSISDQGAVVATRTEELLSTKDGKSTILRGLIDLLQFQVVLGCSDDIREYLAELVEMSARPAAVVPSTTPISTEHWFVQDIVNLFLAPNGGKRLAETSASCRVNLCRAFLACANLDQFKTSVASSGLLHEFVLLAVPPERDPEQIDDNDEDNDENREMLETCQTAMLKMLYEVVQLPEYASPPQYGVARSALDLLPDPAHVGPQPYLQAAGLVLLYGFIDGDLRANMLVKDGQLIERIYKVLEQDDKMVLHPAISLAAKLAVTWSLRPLLYAQEDHTLLARRLLLLPSVGFEIPATTITYLELMIRGHPEHVGILGTGSTGEDVRQNLLQLFQKGQEAINFEIGQLFMEAISLLAQQDQKRITGESSSAVSDFLRSVDVEGWSQVLVFMGTKTWNINPVIADRVWYVLGILSINEEGREIVARALRDDSMRQRFENLVAEEGSPLGDNVKFVAHNLRTHTTDDGILAKALASMNLR